MTDRYNYITVGLEKDIRDDDAEALISAIKQLRGVGSVGPNISDPTAWTAENRARRELEQKIFNVLRTDA